MIAKAILLSIAAGITAAAPVEAEPVTIEVLEYTVKAQDAICSALSHYPTIGGVSAILASVVEHGFTPYEAGQVVALSVMDNCPQFLPVLDRFVAVFAA